MIYNPKLNESIFDINDIISNEDLNDSTIGIDNNSNYLNIKALTDYSKDLNTLIEKYENKLKLLSEQNKVLKSQINDRKYEKEITLLKSKLAEGENANKKLSNQISNITQVCKGLESKVKDLEKRNLKYQEQTKNLNLKLIKFDGMKSKIDSIEGMLNRSNNLSNISKENETEEKNAMLSYRLKDKNKMSLFLEKETKEEGNEKNVNSLINSHRTNQIKKEINTLDEEIIVLKKKVKNLLYKK